MSHMVIWICTSSAGQVFHLPYTEYTLKHAYSEASDRFELHLAYKTSRHVPSDTNSIAGMDAQYVCRAFRVGGMQCWIVLQERGLKFALTALKPNNFADVLHLAINRLQQLYIISYQQKKLAHKVLQEHMTAQLLQQLLQTAAERGHQANLDSLCSFPAIQHLDAEAVKQLFVIVLQ